MPQPSFDPPTRGSALASDADRAFCRAAIRSGSRSFYVASLLMPRAARMDAYALYAFCRSADDAVDCEGLGRQTDRSAAVARLRERLARAYEGRPVDSPIDRAFADMAAAHGLPRALPEALLEGFDWDARGRRYETIDELRDYAARVAGSVGAMMAVLMGVRAPEALARAADLGVAMQLTNIARDVGEDARLGRLYLPRLWMREAGLDPDRFLAAPKADARLGIVVERLLREADSLYRRAETGIVALPMSCRPAIWAARLIYAEIGAEIRRLGGDAISSRARTSAARKLVLVLTALVSAARWRAVDRAPALAETRYLVEAGLRAPAPGGLARRSVFARIDDRIGRVIEMCERLEASEEGDRPAI